MPDATQLDREAEELEARLRAKAGPRYCGITHENDGNWWVDVMFRQLGQLRHTWFVRATPAEALRAALAAVEAAIEARKGGRA